MRFRHIEDKRGDQRYAYPKTVEYLAGRENGTACSKAVVVNISRSGICLYLYDQHDVGQHLVITSPLPVEHRTGVVRWTRKINEGFYQAGVRFTGRDH